MDDEVQMWDEVSRSPVLSGVLFLTALGSFTVTALLGAAIGITSLAVRPIHRR